MIANETTIHQSVNKVNISNYRQLYGKTHNVSDIKGPDNSIHNKYDRHVPTITTELQPLDLIRTGTYKGAFYS